MKKVLTLILACLLNGVLLANHWEPCDPGLYSQTNANVLTAFIDGVQQNYESLEIAIFSGDECRGSTMASWFPYTEEYIFYLNAYGENGHVMYFKLYDHNTGIEYEQDPTQGTIIFEEDGVGLLGAPYEVHFVSPIQQFTITVEANPTEGGTVEGDGIYDEGTECTLTATANDGYVFANWTEDGEEVSTDAEYTFTVTGDRDLVANFEIVTTFLFVTEGNWSDASNWNSNTLPGIYDEAIIEANCLLDIDVTVAQMTITEGVALTLQSGKVLTVTGNLTNTEVESLVIKDGAQFINTPTPSEREVSIDFSQQGYSNGQDLNGVVIPIDDNVSIVFNKNNGTNGPKYYTSGTAIRVYPKNTFVVASAGTITSITLTYGTSDGSNTITTNVGLFASPVWTGSSSAVTFSIGGSSGNRRIKAVAVTYLIEGDVMATVEKEIIGYEGQSGWYTIASPMNEMEIEESDFLNPEFDLYRYNEGREGEEWENYKDVSNEDFTLFENGRGYLYANSNTFTPTFVGALNGSDVTTYLMYSERPDQLSGFNLIGNPFPHVIYKGNGGAIDNELLASGFYTLTNEGAWHVCTYQDAIMPGQGILIKTTEEMDLTINKTNARANGEVGNAKAAMPSMNIKLSGEAGNDRAVVYFGQGINLNKIDNPTEGAPMLYIHNEGGDYAIAHLSQDAEMLGLMFQNTTASTFTLTVASSDTNFSYLHLIDHVAGNEVDLLLQPSYTFTTVGNENAARFSLVFKVETGIDEEQTESFCFAKDGVLYIVTDTENAYVALMDVLGRTVKQANATRFDITDLKAGVYVVRMDNGNDVKVQKIIIK